MAKALRKTFLFDARTIYLLEKTAEVTGSSFTKIVIKGIHQYVDSLPSQWRDDIMSQVAEKFQGE